MPAEVMCPRCEDIAAFLADELAIDERVAFEAHLLKCERCSDAVKSARSIVSLLHSAPRAEVSRDLAPAILATLRGQSNTPLWPRVAGLAAAAAIIITLGLSKAWLSARPRPAAPLASTAPRESEAASATRALDWLCKAQEPDGSWSATRWGGDRRFEVALTALPLMALLSSEQPTPEHSTAVAKAVDALMKSQAANGSFGDAFFGSCYNQGIATLALLRAYQRQPDAELKRTIEAAFDVIRITQTASGGWGYLGSPQPHPAVTLWNVDALKLAAALGIANVQPSLDRGTRWMQEHSSPPRGATPASDVDFYQAFFLASVLKQSDDAPSREKLATIRHALLISQVRDGSDSGSWAPDDQWGRVGGRLYSTALASLSLR